MSCTYNLYRYFLTDEHSHEQRQSINSVAMTKIADLGSGRGGWEEGEECEREGRGFETSQQQIFFLFFLFGRYKNAFCSQTDSKGAPNHLKQS